MNNELTELMTKRDNYTKDDLAKEKQLREEFKTKRNIKRGLKQFDIDGKIITALNYENAVRKANNLK